MKIDVSITNEELKELKGNRDLITNLLVSRALYNESLDKKFDPSQEKELKFLIENEKLKYYISKHIDTDREVSETQIIDEYNVNKRLFEKDKIPFSEARNIIKEELQQKINIELSEEIVSGLIDEMEENVVLTKEQIKFSNGNPNYIKTLVVINILKNDKKAQKFFEDNKLIINSLAENVRLNYYIELIVRANLKVEEAEVEKIYEKEKDKFADVTIANAYQIIGNKIVEAKSTEIRRSISLNAIERYKLKDLIEEYIKKSE